MLTHPNSSKIYTVRCNMICKRCGESFKANTVIDGIQHNLGNRKYCLECSPFKKHNTKKLYLTEKDKIKAESNVKKVIAFRKRQISRAKEYLGNKCCICGYTKCTEALEFHHLDPKEKMFSISSNSNKKWETLLPEINKCVLLCANCHREVEYGHTKFTSSETVSQEAVNFEIGGSSPS